MLQYIMSFTCLTIKPMSPTPLSIGDDVSGSGSGMCSDVLCPRSSSPAIPSTDRPLHGVVQWSPPENKKVKGAAHQNLPSIAVYLLSLLMLLLRR